MEKFCPACGAVYPQEGDATHCDADGEKLVVLDHEPDLVGRQLDGKYLIRDIIGEGGMGKVYLAYQASVDREVAIKVLRPQYSRNKLAIKRFHREAKAASRLAHPNTITVYDSGQTDDHLLYQVIELLNGKPLEQILDDDGPLEPLRAVNIVAQICDSLAEAHAACITHRDLKPDNIFIEPKYGNPEFVKVLDFGIAKISDAGVTQATATGMICGTPSYMSPEQAMGRDLDGRSDIYSLGILLFEMLSGERPFEGDSPMEVMLKHINGEIPQLPEGIAGSLAPGFNEVLAWMLAKKPDDRPDDCQILKARLRAVVEGAAPTAPSAVPADPPPIPGATKEAGRDDPTLNGPPARLQTDDPSLEKTGLSPAVSPGAAGWAATKTDTPQWIVALAAVVFLGIGGGAAWYFLAGPGRAEPGAASATADGASSGVGAPVAPAAAGGADAAPKAAEVAPPAAGVAAAEGAAAAPVSPVSAQTVTLTINSSPPGASVIDADGATLGKTPISLTRSVDVGGFNVTLALEGHLSTVLAVDPSKGTEWNAALAKMPPAVDPPTGDADPAGDTPVGEPAAKKKAVARKSAARKSDVGSPKADTGSSPDKKPDKKPGTKPDTKYDDGGKRGFGTF